MARKKHEDISFEEVETILLTKHKKELVEMIQVTEEVPGDPETTTRIVEQIQDNRFRRSVTKAILAMLGLLILVVVFAPEKLDAVMQVAQLVLAGTSGWALASMNKATSK